MPSFNLVSSIAVILKNSLYSPNPSPGAIATPCSNSFSEKLLKHGVAIAPGEGFGDYKEFFRLTAIDRTKLEEGMTILDSVLKEL